VLSNEAKGGDRNLKLDESCTSNPKSEISDWTGKQNWAQGVEFEISDFGFEVQDSSNFKFPAFEGCADHRETPSRKRNTRSMVGWYYLFE